MKLLVTGGTGFIGSHLAEQGRADFRAYGESRPDTAEEAAVAQLISFAETSGTPVYVVHLSSARALAACAAARSRGVPVYVETRPLYLHLTEELLDGSRLARLDPFLDSVLNLNERKVRCAELSLYSIADARCTGGRECRRAAV